MSAIAPTPIDPRLIADRPGIRGAARDIGRKVTQGEVGSLPVVVALIGVWVYFYVSNHKFISAGNIRKRQANAARIYDTVYSGTGAASSAKIDVRVIQLIARSPRGK